MSNLNESFSDLEGDAPNRHARRTVESMIADHVADAMAIERLAAERYELIDFNHGSPAWRDIDIKQKEYWLIEAKLHVLKWLNREQGTDYHLED